MIAALLAAVRAAAVLPGEGWAGRIAPGAGDVSPSGPIEAFLVAVLVSLATREPESEAKFDEVRSRLAGGRAVGPSGGLRG